MYIIAWRSKITGSEGRGTAPMCYEEAKKAVEELNKKWPELDHWLEKVS